MSKIEKALKRAGDERGNLQLVAAAAGGRPMPWTSLLGQQIENPETISRMAENEGRLLSAAELRARGIIHPQHTEEPVVQVFRELRTKIIQQNQGQNAVILVAGVSKGNGASFIARNLGAAFAFDSAKTALLVDCNLRNPSVHQLLRNPSLPGLADYFENPKIDVSRIIHPVGIARFRAISSGGLREIPAEYFVSMKMRHLMDTLRERYRERFIILDGPPMSDIADARILSELADYVLVVVRHGRATNAQIENGLSAISDKKLLGIVFNDEPRIPWTR
jgi:capsular exopolysaccharide synthesis family protein